MRNPTADKIRIRGSQGPADSLARLFVGSLVALCTFAVPAHANSCWFAISWTSHSWVGAQAILLPADCTKIPQDRGWLKVTRNYGHPPADTLWLQIRLNDYWVSHWRFRPQLYFSHYDQRGRPVVLTNLIPSVPEHPANDSNWIQLLPYPPEQGVPVPGLRVRLRNRRTGLCIYSLNRNGHPAYNSSCSNDPNMVYMIDDAGSGLVRLRHEQTGQCLYTIDQGGSYQTPLYNWGCWNDPNMTFSFSPELHGGLGYALKHSNTFRCPYGNSTNFGMVYTEPCDGGIVTDMIFAVDIIGGKPVNLICPSCPPPTSPE
jgi:hypothetical protein